jgi:ADP-ribose pyrophosphatase YjhB (NUDIX family)
MGRVDYYHDPNAPRANSLVPGASAIVVNDEGKILLHRRSDNARWALPGGVMDIGESIAQTVTREVREETGLEVEPEYIVGVYSDPGHVFAYDDGEVRQQFSVCFACRIVGGQVRTSEESSEVAFFAPAEVDTLDMHESIRIRIRHYLSAALRRSSPDRVRNLCCRSRPSVRSMAASRYGVACRSASTISPSPYRCSTSATRSSNVIGSPVGPVVRSQ